jgi:hypothetical protein
LGVCCRSQTLVGAKAGGGGIVNKAKQQFKTYLRMSSFPKQHCWCYRDLDGRCSREPPAVVAPVGLELLARMAIDVAGEGCGWEYEVMDSD